MLKPECALIKVRSDLFLGLRLGLLSLFPLPEFDFPYEFLELTLDPPLHLLLALLRRDLP